MGPPNSLFCCFSFSKKLGHVGDRYAVELKPKIPTSGLDSQFLFPPPRHHCPSALGIYLLVYFANSPLTSTPNPSRLKSPPKHLHPLPSYCASTTPCAPPTVAEIPSAQVRLSTWHCELPESRNCAYTLPYPQCSAKCLGSSSTQCIILTVYLKKPSTFPFGTPNPHSHITIFR